jgi:2,4'-dihydroxyacetophenone dioxygenase
VLKGLPGGVLGTHYHVGTVRGLYDAWALEVSRAQLGRKAWDFHGEAHTLVITQDSPEPALIMFVVEGGLIYLDKPTYGGVAAYEDGFTVLELTQKYYREAGLDVHQLDRLIRS